MIWMMNFSRPLGIIELQSQKNCLVHCSKRAVLHMDNHHRADGVHCQAMIHQGGGTLTNLHRSEYRFPQLRVDPQHCALSILSACSCTAVHCRLRVPVLLQFWNRARHTLGLLIPLSFFSSGHGKGNCGETLPQIDPLNMEGFSQEEMHDRILGLSTKQLL